jgi:2-amino-4-hydroxy-6-hydroxymethyldihydropteridine diphosphokinase
MSQALIGLGSNLGDRQRFLDAAVAELAATDGIQNVRASSWRNTPAIGGGNAQPDFLNGAAVLETSLSPEALFARLQQIESGLGRERHKRWAQRTIDLDLLLFDDVVQRGPMLDLPHSRMAFRRFVIEPAAEVAPTMRHPLIGWTMAELLHHLQTATPYVAISGDLSSKSNTLAAAVATQTGWQFIECPAGFADVASTSSGLTPARAIEFLHRQAEALARDRWPNDSPGAVSSFWIEDVLAMGDALWPGALNDAWQSISPLIVRPKLLVCCRETSMPPSTGGASGTRVRAQRPGIGPVLWIDANDAAGAQTEINAQTEIVAAIQAMS